VSNEMERSSWMTQTCIYKDLKEVSHGVDQGIITAIAWRG